MITRFGLASLGASATGNLPTLLFFRVQQALAEATVLPNGTALVRDLVPADRRASRFGRIGAAIAPAAAAVSRSVAAWDATRRDAASHNQPLATRWPSH